MPPHTFPIPTPTFVGHGRVQPQSGERCGVLRLLRLEFRVPVLGFQPFDLNVLHKAELFDKGCGRPCDGEVSAAAAVAPTPGEPPTVRSGVRRRLVGAGQRATRYAHCAAIFSRQHRENGLHCTECECSASQQASHTPSSCFLALESDSAQLVPRERHCISLCFLPVAEEHVIDSARSPQTPATTTTNQASLLASLSIFFLPLKYPGSRPPPPSNVRPSTILTAPQMPSSGGLVPKTLLSAVRVARTVGVPLL